MTLFVRGRVRLPEPEDVEGIVRLSGEAYLTAPSQLELPGVARPQDAHVQHTAASRQLALPAMGHVRLRTSAVDRSVTWTVRLSGKAHRLATGTPTL